MAESRSLGQHESECQRFPGWSRELALDMKAESLAFFEEVIWKQNRPLADLMNAKVTFATRLATPTGLSLPRGRAWPSMICRRAGAGGLLTQGVC